MSLIEPPDPKAQPLLHVLVEEMRRGGIRAGDPQTFPTYSFLLARLGRPSPHYFAGRRLQKLGLTALNDWTLRHEELPKITALIVSRSSHLPGKGFAESHGHVGDISSWRSWWLQEAARAVSYDWTPFLVSTTYESGSEKNTECKVREGEDEIDIGSIIVMDPPPARIRQSEITVAEVLQWLAAGESEKEILRLHPGLQKEDIRASLVYAAEREMKSAKAATFSTRWLGKFALPEADPEDERLSYLLRRYERSSV
ncbi:DUF433 domain-containing protein [Prosthecobacter sp.]|uniref:DUF433 domain-containing protein n=1 Tax=Prosthecobacter sp. TaxID=1965333 RepID=UPI0037833477